MRQQTGKVTAQLKLKTLNDNPYSNKDLITLNEVQNDGKTIHLYFNQEVGLYVAYGCSAFCAAHIVNIIAAFSEDMQMPVALL